MIGSPARRWGLLAVLILVIVACLATSAGIVLQRAAGDGLGDRIASLRDDDVPGTGVADTREQLLSLSREFATRFNTYDPSMLDDSGHLPDYAAVADLMTPKFADIFDKNVGYAEQTVKQLNVTSTGTVYAVGVASQDSDSAEVLVAGTIELSYPYPGKGTDSGSGDQQQVSTGPQRFRYQVSLVKLEGSWLVDDVDDIDDGQPPFSQPSVPEDQQTPSAPPSETAPSTPSDAPTSEQTGKGGR